MGKALIIAAASTLLWSAADGCNDAGEDLDADGWTTQAGDCDDSNPIQNPAADERCDSAGLDEDCDGLVNDEDNSVVDATITFEDADGDGYGAPDKGSLSCSSAQPGVANGQDCDDSNPLANPDRPGSCSNSGVVVLSPDGNDGQGYGFDSIQEALDSAPLGSTIYLEPGEYQVNLTLPRRDVHLAGTLFGQITLNGAQCLQGEGRCSVARAVWASEGGAMASRQPSLTSLVLTGGKGTTGIELGQQASRTHGGGMAVSNANPTLVNIDARGNEADRGGGLWMDQSQPTIQGLMLLGNTAETGGGAYAGFSDLDLTDVVIQGNQAATGGGIAIDNTDGNATNLMVKGNTAEYGGGLNLTLSSPTFVGLTVEGNDASDIGGGLYLYDSLATFNTLNLIDNTAKSGAGLNASYASTPIFNLTAYGNRSEEYGGALYLYESQPVINGGTLSDNHSDVGGAIFISYGHPRLNNLMISENTSTSSGGGIYASSSRAHLTNVVISNNHSDAKGGGIFESYSDLTLSNVTVAHNSADEGGGIYMFFESSPVLDSTIVAFNSATTGAANMFVHESSEPSLSYDLFYDGSSHGIEGVVPGPTSLIVDPEFADDVYHLANGSPAVDAGQPSPTQNDPDGSRNDMGAYGGPGAER